MPVDDPSFPLSDAAASEPFLDIERESLSKPPPAPDTDEDQILILRQAQYDFYTKRLRFPPALASFASGNLIPDNLPQRTVLGQNVTPSAHIVRGVKFMILTFSFIWFCREFVRESHLELDETMHLQQFRLFFFLPCLQDTLCFFALGRLAYRRGVDCVNFFFPCA
jgi:hypothetical protein